MNQKLLIGLTLAALVGGFGFVYLQNRSSGETNRTNPTQEELDKMNAEDSTLESEKETSEGAATSPANAQTAGSKKSASVIITQAESSESLVEVRAYANVFENGTCTATFTKGGENKTYTENTEQQAQYTQCNPFQIPKADFSSGTWKVTVVFDSTTYKGQASQDISI